MNEPLKPCPFCGGPAESDSNRIFRSMRGKVGYVVAIYCTRCSAEMAMPHDEHPKYAPEDILTIMAEAWNRRVHEPTLSDTNPAQRSE